MNAPPRNRELVITPPRSRRELAAFVRLPWRLNAGNPNWVAPLLRDSWAATHARHSPLLASGPHQLWLAWRTGASGRREVVGRVAAVVDGRQGAAGTAGPTSTIGNFMLFECADDEAAAKALLAAAAAFVRRHGASRLRGPVSPVEGDSYRGILVDGFASRPTWGQSYNPPYYDRLIRASGFGKATDYCARKSRLEQVPRREAAVQAAMKRYSFATCAFDLRRFEREVSDIHNVLLRSFPADWADIPRPALQEAQRMGRELRRFVPPELVRIARQGGSSGPAIGFSVTTPDFNQVLHHAQGSLLRPWAWPAMARAWRRIDTVRLSLLFVLPEYQRRGVSAALYHDTVGAALRLGYRWGVGSSYDEANAAIGREAASLGGEVCATMRIYEKTLEL